MTRVESSFSDAPFSSFDVKKITQMSSIKMSIINKKYHQQVETTKMSSKGNHKSFDNMMINVRNNT